MLKKRRAERPEFIRRKSQYSRPSLMHKSAGGVPRLNLLAEKELDLCRVFLRDIQEDGIIEGLEHLGGERTDVVEVKLDLGSLEGQRSFFEQNN